MAAPESPQGHHRTTPALVGVNIPSLEGVSQIRSSRTGPTWEIGPEICHTGMSTVREARLVGLRRFTRRGRNEYVIKALSGGYPDVLFDREVEIHSGLRHSRVIRLRDSGKTDTSAGEEIKFMVMDRVNGSVVDEVSQQGEYSPQHAAEATAQMGKALLYVHGKGWVHADFKPGNILVDGKSNFLLTDFGLADRSPIIEHGRPPATHEYYAPEQFGPRRAYPESDRITNPESDKYALALSLYYMLTGEDLWNIGVFDHVAAVQEPNAHDEFVAGKINTLPYPALREPLTQALVYNHEARASQTIVDFTKAVRSGASTKRKRRK